MRKQILIKRTPLLLYHPYPLHPTICPFCNLNQSRTSQFYNERSVEEGKQRWQNTILQQFSIQRQMFHIATKSHGTTFSAFDIFFHIQKIISSYVDSLTWFAKSKKLFLKLKKKVSNTVNVVPLVALNCIVESTKCRAIFQSGNPRSSNFQQHKVFEYV